MNSLNLWICFGFVGLVIIWFQVSNSMVSIRKKEGEYYTFGLLVPEHRR